LYNPDEFTLYKIQSALKTIAKAFVLWQHHADSSHIPFEKQAYGKKISLASHKFFLSVIHKKFIFFS